MKKSTMREVPSRKKGILTASAANSVRLADVIAFLEVFKRVDTGAPESRATFRSLAKELGSLTTLMGQLDRIAEFLYGPDEPPRAGLRRLFSKDTEGQLVPTDEARAVYKHFVKLKEMYAETKSVIARAETDGPPAVIRVGTTQTIALRLLATCFSDWRRLFVGQTRLDLRIDRSRELIPLLSAGLLDVVISYGLKDQEEKGVTVQPLGYKSRMVLLSHPTEQLLTKQGQNLNKDYWEKSYHDRKGKPVIPAYDDLREADLKQILFNPTRLIVVPSWRLPKALESLTQTLRPDRLIEVPWYDEGLALTRMGVGVAVATEVFATRRRITAFRLKSPEHFERLICAYFRAGEAIPRHVHEFTSVLKEYLKEFEPALRTGDPPAFGDPAYAAFCDRMAALREAQEGAG
jgi:DNA-binding transcriptional LysR family regulator